MVGGYINLDKRTTRKSHVLNFLTTKYNLDWIVDIVKEHGILQYQVIIYVTEAEFAMLVMTQDIQKIYNEIHAKIPAMYKIRIFYKDPSLKQKKFINLKL